VDGQTALDQTNLNLRDDEIRAIEESLGTGLVPSTDDPLSDYMRLVEDSGATPQHNLYLAHESGLGARVSVGVVDLSSAPAKPLGRLHVRSETLSGVTPSTGADDIVVDNALNAGISILFGATGTGSIYFGSASGGASRARIEYDAGSSTFNIGTNDANGKLRLRTGLNTLAVGIDADTSTTFHGDVTAEENVVIGATTTPVRPLMVGQTSTAGAAFENSGARATAVGVYLDANPGADGALAELHGRWNGSEVARIEFLAGADGMNKDEGEIAFRTSPTGSATVERARFTKEGGLHFKELSSNPPSKSGYAAIYAKDTSGTAEMWVMDGAGVATQISPHDPDTGEWIFYSENLRTGQKIRIDMEQAVRAVEELTGETFIEETTTRDV
jgi:hypothetical protein